MPTVASAEKTERVVVTAPTVGCDEVSQRDAVVRKTPILPVALRDDQITESDFRLLVRIAEDSGAVSGRLRRPTSSIPSVKSTDG